MKPAAGLPVMRGLPEPAHGFGFPAVFFAAHFPAPFLPVRIACRRAPKGYFPLPAPVPGEAFRTGKQVVEVFGRIGEAAVESLFKPRKGPPGRIRAQSVRVMEGRLGIDAVDFETVPEVIRVADHVLAERMPRLGLAQYVVPHFFQGGEGHGLARRRRQLPATHGEEHGAGAAPADSLFQEGRGLFAVDFQRGIFPNVPLAHVRAGEETQGVRVSRIGSLAQEPHALGRFFRIELHPYKPDAFFGLVRKHLFHDPVSTGAVQPGFPFSRLPRAVFSLLW